MVDFQENLKNFIFRPKMTIFGTSTPEQDFSVTEDYYQMITTDPQHLPNFQKNVMTDFEENLKFFIFGPKMMIFGTSTPEQDFSLNEDYHQIITTMIL